MKLLIVDDQPIMRAMIRLLCTAADDEVFECSDGLDALPAYERHRPDWIIMDVMMPGLDGLKATARIMTSHPNARVVIVTQETDSSFRRAAADAGAFAFFTKDDLSQVRDLVQRQ